MLKGKGKKGAGKREKKELVKFVKRQGEKNMERKECP